MTNDAFFSLLAQELGERAARACVSQIGPRSEPLRRHLLAALASPPGHGTGFLAKPVFEALFDWESANSTLAELELLHPSLLAALSRSVQQGDATTEPLFPSDRRPYVHQVKAWRALLEPPGRSVLIRTGTSSGKTESFLVPVLDSLARELAAQGSTGPLVGVRALFLYPLNALINSQRERLLAGTAPFDQRIRFCLYNGNTKERLRGREQLVGPEVMDRCLLREQPPPMLITNATMLEYMLVRQADAPILEKSAGKLRYIILDEAHTYLGSAAAEIALLLRRVMHAFRVDSKSVRFVATSATIGGKDAEGKLGEFLAQLAGVAVDQVVVVSGQRAAPPIPDNFHQEHAGLPTVYELSQLKNPEAVGARLARSEAFRELRTRLNTAPLALDKVAAVLGEDLSEKAALELLDAASGAELDGHHLLPLRGHFFMRTLEGVWCCTNGACSGRTETPLADSAWPWGMTFFSRRDHCDACRAIVAELVVCRRCGEAYGVMEENEHNALTGAAWPLGEDFDAPDDTSDPLQDEDDEPDTRGAIRLLASEEGARNAEGGAGTTDTYDPGTGRRDAGSNVVRFASTSRAKALRCGSCGGVHGAERSVFRRARLGVNFLLRNALWTVGERMPPSGAKGTRPADGRRLITFTDSRQGTARHALQSQIEAERTWVRAYVYHHLWAEARRHGGHALNDVTELEKELRALEPLVSQAPALRPMVDAKRIKLTELQSAPFAGIKWSDIRRQLSQERTASWIREAMQRSYEPARLDDTQRAELWLLREFGQRLPRQASLENLGLVRFDYPALRAEAPSYWLSQGFDGDGWRSFLRFILESFVRGQTPIAIEWDVRRWLAQYIVPRSLVAQDEEASSKTTPWPTAKRVRLSNPVRVMFRALKLNTDSKDDRDLVTNLLHSAWSQLTDSLYFKRFETGYRLALDDVHLTPVREGMLCPVTGRIGTATLFGFSPHSTLAHHGVSERVTMPEPVALFGDNLAQTEAWLQSNPEIQSLRARGVWTEFSDRIVRYGPVLYMTSAEHSAQVSKQLLQPLEKAFREGKVNILHCSTTMEMGVDIGGLTGVVMNNTPPAPANYSQRAGRAGRRGEARAVVLTMCPPTSHAQAVFQKPVWPFVTHVRPPEVALTSERIVQRHLHSSFLAAFLCERSISDSHVMTCRGFLLPPPAQDLSLFGLMCEWLSSLPDESRTIQNAKALLRGTALDGQVVSRLLVMQNEMKALENSWGVERNAQVEELQRLGGSLEKPWEEAEAPERSVRIAIRRLDDDFLLRFLATRGFLPAYGFPLSVVPLVTMNLEELAHDRKQRGRAREAGDVAEDRPDPSQGYPTRSLDRALQEYAPGNRVLINGTVREPGGVTLNWRAPAGRQAANEPQSRRCFWRCLSCGEMDDSARAMEHCPKCGGQQMKQLWFLEPSGFAVDIREKPHNDTQQRHLASPPVSLVSASGTAWQALPTPSLGRYRHSHEGKLFSYVYGEHDKGYAVCCYCGRVEAMQSSGVLPKAFTTHKRLRGGKKGSDNESACPGAAGGFGAWIHLGFGGTRRTDVFELELRDPVQGGPLGGPEASKASVTLGAALREGLARRLGIDPRELGFATRQITQDGVKHWVIALFDRADGGAGYVAQAVYDLRGLLDEAKKVMECPNGCDRICHACLLSFDTDRYAPDLDRRLGLRLLSEPVLNALSLPQEFKVFGETTSFEPHGLRTALTMFLQTVGKADLIRVCWGSHSEDWEFQDWPLRALLLAQAALGTRIEIIAPRVVLEALPWDETNVLAGQLDASGFVLIADEDVHAASSLMHVCLEVMAGAMSKRWAVSNVAGLSPGPRWGCGTADEDVEQLRITRVMTNGGVAPVAGKEMSLDALRKPVPSQSMVRQINLPRGASLADLGPVFWRALWTQKSEPFPAAQGTTLISAEYSDRYLSSPLAARAFHALLVGLREYGLTRTTRLAVRTCRPAQGRDHDCLHSNFYGGGAQLQVLQGLLGDLADTVSVKVEDQSRDLPHARILSLKWSDGTALRLGLDQGVGFVETRRRERFAGQSPPAEQVKELLKCRVDLSSEKDTWVWTQRV